VPNAYVHDANFTDAISADRTVTVDGGFTVGSMNFDNAHRYTVNGPGAITLDDSFAANVHVIQGSHVINAALTPGRNLTVAIESETAGRGDDATFDAAHELPNRQGIEELVRDEQERLFGKLFDLIVPASIRNGAPLSISQRRAGLDEVRSASETRRTKHPQGVSSQRPPPRP